MENDDQLQTNTYVWSQSNDQVTISFLVPESAKSKDLDISIERQYLKAGLRGDEPVIQVSPALYIYLSVFLEPMTTKQSLPDRPNYSNLSITLNPSGNSKRTACHPSLP